MSHIKVDYLPEKGAIVYLDDEILLDLSDSDSTDDMLTRILRHLDYKPTIEYLYDEYECECCGFCSAQGAMVYIQDNLILELQPHAYCFDGDDFSKSDIMIKILEHFGYTVELDT